MTLRGKKIWETMRKAEGIWCYVVTDRLWQLCLKPVHDFKAIY